MDSIKIAYTVCFYGRDIIPLFDRCVAEGNPPDAPGNFSSWLYKIMTVYAYKGEGECIDIGTPENYAEMREEYKDKCC